MLLTIEGPEATSVPVARPRVVTDAFYATSSGPGGPLDHRGDMTMLYDSTGVQRETIDDEPTFDEFAAAQPEANRGLPGEGDEEAAWSEAQAAAWPHVDAAVAQDLLLDSSQSYLIEIGRV